MCKSDENLFLPPWGWRELVEVCANPMIIFRGKARSLLQRSGGREFGRVCANPMGIFWRRDKGG